MLRLEYMEFKNRSRPTPNIPILFRAVELCELADKVYKDFVEEEKFYSSDTEYENGDYDTDCDTISFYLSLNDDEDDADDEYESGSNISRSDSSDYDRDGGSDGVFFESGNEELDASSDLEYLPFP